MTDEQLDKFADDVRYIRERVDDHGKQLTDLRVSVEHRVTKLEMKAGLWGFLGGAIAGLGFLWKKP